MFTTNENSSRPMGPFSGLSAGDTNPYGTVKNSIPSPMNPGDSGGGLGAALRGSFGVGGGGGIRNLRNSMMSGFGRASGAPNFSQPQTRPAALPPVNPSGLAPAQSVPMAGAQPSQPQSEMPLPPLTSVMNQLPREAQMALSQLLQQLFASK